jgi:DNA-binding XRE family transcriptional regulator
MSTNPAFGVVPEFTVGDRLRKARQLTELTTRQFAEEIGVSQKTITDAEGDRRATRKIVMRAYAMRTGVSLEWLETGIAPETLGSGGGGGGQSEGNAGVATRHARTCV